MKTSIKILIFFTLGFFFSSVATFIVFPEYPELNYTTLTLSFLFLFTLIFIYRNTLLSFIRSSYAKDLIQQFINIVLIICIFGVINTLIYKNNLYFDLTKNKIHTLSEESLKLMHSIKGEKLTFKMFAKRNEWSRYLKLLRLYRLAHPNITLEMLDIEREIGSVNLYKVKENGTLVIIHNQQEHSVMAKNELAITNLIKKIFNPNKKIIYYSYSHGELDLNETGFQGGSFLKSQMINNYLQLKKLDLEKGVPQDAAAVLILNPQTAFLTREIQELQKYLTNGGELLLSFSPHFDKLHITNLTDFLKRQGLAFQNVLILDRLAKEQGSQATIPVINHYQPHKISQNFDGRTLFPFSAALKIQSNNHMNWSSLITTSPFPATWGESNFSQVKNGRATYEDKQDLKGPLTIFAVGENHQSKIAVYSSTQFLMNQFQGHSHNFNLFLNTLNWIVGEEKLMSLTRPNLKGNPVYISELQLSLIFYFAVLFFPFLFFGLGIYFYRVKMSR